MHRDAVDLRPQSTSKHLWEFAVLAHEIKQPLAAILSNAQAAWRLLALDAPDVQEVREALADIIMDARRTDEVLRRLQAFVTTGAQELARLNINDIIRETIGLVHRDATVQGVRITVTLAADLPLVYGDRIQLRQVLLNLVRNALEAMSQVMEGDRTLVVQTSSTTLGVITVEVQDRGIGIDEATVQHLFHPFFTTKTGGMGLGLTLSRSIIAAHGGWIWATRNPERGLTMSFTLPAV
jgi:C4-dicarboxylate-specific signal transduction histidine kinase